MLSTALRRVLVPTIAAAVCATALTSAEPARAAGPQVSVVLTTTTDGGGRDVSRGLQPQDPIQFHAGPGAAATETIAVDESRRYQTFSGAGASITDTTAHLLRGGAVSAQTRDEVMRKLFDARDGIGLTFLRNPIGASDLSRPGMVSLDDTCCTLADFGANGYDTNVRLLTRQARQLSPQLKIMASPWSAPGWMKDNGRMDHMGSLQPRYYGLFAQYLVKYLQSYRDAGVKVEYVSVQNEPNCCKADDPPAMDYPGMAWSAANLAVFTRDHLYPALRAAGLPTKVLVHDFNYGDYANLGAVLLADAGVRADPLFGGVAWHGYWGNPGTGSAMRDTYPSTPQFSTEHSGGTWVENQHNADLDDIVSYGRNFSRSIVKWSLALDENHGPHNGGCGICTGLVTVRGDGTVAYTVEYYTTGHLTKFVRPGAQRIASTDTPLVRNIAYRNGDGGKALIAHNDGDEPRTLTVRWGGQSFTYSLPAHTTATFTWAGAQPGTTPPATGPITNADGRCLDPTAHMGGCRGQAWQRRADGTLRARGACLAAADTSDGATVRPAECDGSAAQQWRFTAGADLVNPAADKCLAAAEGGGVRLQSCSGADTEKWTVP